MRRRLGVACILGGLAVSGCAGTMKETFQQPPRSLDADPATTGLVVLDFSLGPEGGGLPLIVHGAHIQGTAAGSPDIYAPRFEVAGEPMGVLFPGVPPGRYRVTRLLAYDSHYDVNTKSQTPDIRAWSVADSALAFDVLAGGLSYVGRFYASTQGRKVSVSWFHDPMHERTVWRAVERKYPQSRWDAAIEQRVAAIEPLVSESPLADSTRQETFDNIVMAEKLGSFSLRAGPVGFGSNLIVGRDRLEYVGKKSTLIIMATQLRSVRRNDKWVIVDYDHEGATKRLSSGSGSTRIPRQRTGSNSRSPHFFDVGRSSTRTPITEPGRRVW